MNDLISRQAAIEAIVNTVSKVDDNKTLNDKYDGAAFRQLEIIDTIKDLPPAQQWIPVEERLPEEDGNYYVTVAFVGYENEVSLYTEITSFSAKEREFDDNGIDNYGWDYVTAWMPLQWHKPYAPTQSNDSKALDALKGVDDGP